MSARLTRATSPSTPRVVRGCSTSSSRARHHEPRHLLGVLHLRQSHRPTGDQGRREEGLLDGTLRITSADNAITLATPGFGSGISRPPTPLATTSTTPRLGPELGQASPAVAAGGDCSDQSYSLQTPSPSPSMSPGPQMPPPDEPPPPLDEPPPEPPPPLPSSGSANSRSSARSSRRR